MKNDRELYASLAYLADTLVSGFDLVDLSDSLRNLVTHVRGEQAQMRTWIDTLADENRRTREALERIAGALAPTSPPHQPGE